MKIIEELCDKISDEISSAECYAKSALMYKQSNAPVAQTYYRIASEKMGHMSLLHTQVTTIIADYKKDNGQPPESMKMLYNILHKKHIEHAAAVKGMLALYKET